MGAHGTAELCLSSFMHAAEPTVLRHQSELPSLLLLRHLQSLLGNHSLHIRLSVQTFCPASTMG